MSRVIDTTLREGEQTPGVVFSLDAKKKIARLVNEIGIDEIEIGIAAPQNRELTKIGAFMKTVLPDQQFSVWSRCRKEDILHAASVKPHCISLSIPASDLHIVKKLGKNRNWILAQLQNSIRLAFDAGIPRVSIGLEDATRADINFLNKLALTAIKNRAFRLRLADTVGVETPDGIVRLIENFRETDIEIGVHCHNDFGMATANAVTALGHGAKWADVTVLGLGERAGNSRMEEVVGYLSIQKGVNRYRTENIHKLSSFIAEITGRLIPEARPIIGKDIFTCETGIHLQGLFADPSTYEPFEPALVCNKRKLITGRKSGRHSIAAAFKRVGLQVPDPLSLNSITNKVRDKAELLNRPITDREIVKIAGIQN